ncbi:hypothetical protein CR513_46093, partial [Mucuna pruriens]
MPYTKYGMIPTFGDLMSHKIHILRKSRKHCKIWTIPARRIGANSLRTLYGHTELHIGLCWGGLPTGLSLIKPIIYRLK